VSGVVTHTINLTVDLKTFETISNLTTLPVNNVDAFSLRRTPPCRSRYK